MCNRHWVLVYNAGKVVNFHIYFSRSLDRFQIFSGSSTTLLKTSSTRQPLSSSDKVRFVPCKNVEHLDIGVVKTLSPWPHGCKVVQL